VSVEGICPTVVSSRVPKKDSHLQIGTSESLSGECITLKGIFFMLKSRMYVYDTDSINIKILNAGAWARSSDRVTVTLPMELEDYIPQVEEFYRQKHNGRKLQWHHLMSNGIVRFIISSRRNSTFSI